MIILRDKISKKTGVIVSGPDQPRFAHFESSKRTSVYDLYTRHAEVARDIHQDALRRFTGNNTLTVDLVRESPIIPENLQGTINHLQQYDVVSVSSGVEIGAILNSSGLSNEQTVRAYQQAFSERDMPVFVEAAGNEGRSQRTGIPRVSDFARNSLVVGEANMGGGRPYVEEHSSRINPTLTADSPFNRNERYQYFNVAPSLTGHEDLIRDWVIDKEIDRAFEQFKQSDQGRGLSDRALSDAYYDISRAKRTELQETEAGRARVNEQVQGYIARPETLHSQIMEGFRRTQTIDANGYTTGIDGTSFSAPEQAGYISGALYEQTQREAQNRPILTKDEITTLAKMATMDTTSREGQAEPMSSYTNRAGEMFVAGGGHGVFRPDIFRKLLDEAYKRIETNPNIDRNSVTATMSGRLAENQRGSETIALRTDLPPGQNMVIDRTRVDISYSVNGTVPNGIVLTVPGQDAHGLSIQNASGSGTHMVSWARQEERFGEIQRPGESWDLRLLNGRDSVVDSARVTLYGYNQGGLMDQMMQYHRQLAAQMTPTPSAAPEAAPAQAPDSKPLAAPGAR